MVHCRAAAVNGTPVFLFTSCKGYTTFFLFFQKKKNPKTVWIPSSCFGGKEMTHTHTKKIPLVSFHRNVIKKCQTRIKGFQCWVSTAGTRELYAGDRSPEPHVQFTRFYEQAAQRPLSEDNVTAASPQQAPDWKFIEVSKSLEFKLVHESWTQDISEAHAGAPWNFWWGGGRWAAAGRLVVREVGRLVSGGWWWAKWVVIGGWYRSWVMVGGGWWGMGGGYWMVAGMVMSYRKWAESQVILSPSSSSTSLSSSSSSSSCALS